MNEQDKHYYDLWLNDFEAWAKSQRDNCEVMIERSRNKRERMITKQDSHTSLNLEFKNIVGDKQ